MEDKLPGGFDWKILLSVFKDYQNLQKSDLKVERLSGLSNYVYKVSVITTDNINSKGNSSAENRLDQPVINCVVYKIFTSYFQCLQDRERELAISQMLQSRGYGPKIYYSSSNSRIEEYWEFNQIKLEEMTQTDKLNSIAHLLAFFHSNKDINLSQYSQCDLISQLRKEKVMQSVQKSINESNLEKDQQLILQYMMQFIFNKKFISYIQQLLTTSQSPIVFAHNDTNSTNMLFDPHSHQIYLLDYEYSGYNYRAFELGNFFNEQLWDYEVPTPPYFQFKKELQLDSSKRDLFFAHYILATLVQTKDENDIKKYLINEMDMQQVIMKILSFQDSKFESEGQIFREIEHLNQEAESGKVMSHVFWLIVAVLSLSYKDLNFDCFTYSQIRFREIQSLYNQKQNESSLP